MSGSILVRVITTQGITMQLFNALDAQEIDKKGEQLDRYWLEKTMCNFHEGL